MCVICRVFDYSTELSYSKTERVTDINDIQHPAIRNAMKMLDMHEIRLTYEADLPARSGLGTSSSFAVGMLNAFYALKGNMQIRRSWQMKQSIWNATFAMKQADGRIKLQHLLVDLIASTLMQMVMKFFR